MRFRSHKAAFVIPWYGRNIPGGAEALCREWAEHLASAGVAVEVLTTTIQQFQSNWNHPGHRPGVRREGRVTVRRFALRPGDHDAFNHINQKLLAGLATGADEELTFFRESANSDDLVKFIEQHREEYLFFFIPYLFGTTYWGVKAAGDRALLIPCLHDEAYARLSRTREIFASVRGLIFNSEPERRLAELLYGPLRTPGVVLGLGLDPAIEGDAASFRRKFKQKAPFILCVGRKDRTKNTDLLVGYFRHYRRVNPESPLQLLFIGSGELGASHPEIRDLGFVSPQDKYDAYAAATALCSPSTNESFSIVLMESWLCGAPVIVNAECAVTRDHVERSSGGLCFKDFYEFEAVLNCLWNRPELGRVLADNGARYARESFRWPTLIDRLEAWLDEVFG
jgi:glycosyltransferase involved in cell wall biosynthesis